MRLTSAIAVFASLLLTQTITAINARQLDVDNSVTPTPQQHQPANLHIAQVGTKTFLAKPSALINKNTVTNDNTIAMDKSNLVFSLDDRIALASKIKEMVTNTNQADAAVLCKNILKMAALSDTDTAMMTKASAVVASKGDSSKMMRSIDNFINAIGQPHEVDQEQNQEQEQFFPSMRCYRATPNWPLCASFCHSGLLNWPACQATCHGASWNWPSCRIF